MSNRHKEIKKNKQTFKLYLFYNDCEVSHINLMLSHSRWHDFTKVWSCVVEETEVTGETPLVQLGDHQPNSHTP